MSTLQLKELSQSGLYRRRKERPESLGLNGILEDKRSNMANALANAICERCRGGFAPAEKIVNSNGELYHEQCFVCAQCFQQFPEGLFYEPERPLLQPSAQTTPPAPYRPQVAVNCLGLREEVIEGGVVGQWPA
ncbi:hypothetical protein FKM82_008907 [Ascaphus truei]